MQTLNFKEVYSKAPSYSQFGQYLDGRYQSEIPNEDDAQLSGHVLHDGPALVTQTWTGGRGEGKSFSIRE